MQAENFRNLQNMRKKMSSFEAKNNLGILMPIVLGKRYCWKYPTEFMTVFKSNIKIQKSIISLYVLPGIN
ncbi:hypothetical protein BpHYR1_009522 [Brachionus plicatilis]|uniref:Uncharacterized protein n=1 Tax=Brachionus plicatilis TaxID=10195 RepID=A0A3M7STQ8_BRAPC|nr:hypothetical protein BpHYR1_009522 [Brachionus plicatilis]